MTRHGATPRRQWPRFRLPGLRWSALRLPRWAWVTSGVGLCLVVAVLSGPRWWPEPEPATVEWTWSGDWVYLDESALESAIAPFRGQGFWDLSLSDIRNAVEQLPWVDRVRVERQWPRQVQLSVTEQVPLARWNEGALLNNRGEAFQPAALPDINLAWLRGPEGQSERVMNHYLWFSRIFSHLDTAIVELSLAERGAWELDLVDGVNVRLGQKDVLARARRAAQVLESVAQNTTSRRLMRIDARYQFAVAVAWESGESA